MFNNYNNSGDTEVFALILSCCSLSLFFAIVVVVLYLLRDILILPPGLGGWSGGQAKNGKLMAITKDMLKKNTDPWHIAGFGGDEKSISISGDSIIFRINKNKSGGESGGMFTSNPLKLFPTEEARIEFDVHLPDTFPLKPNAKTKIVSGKMWGFCLGKQIKDCATGGNYSVDSGSVRMTFNAEDTLAATVYVYPTAKSSDDAWGKQGNEYKKYGHATAKGHKLFLGKGREMPLHHGWNSISLYVKLNTPGQTNGVIKTTVNGVSNQVSDAMLRTDPSVKMTSLKGTIFVGGNGKEWELDQDVDVAIKNVHIS